VRTTKPNPLRATALAVAASLVLAACGQGDPAVDESMEEPSTEEVEEEPATDGAADGEATEADVQFVQGMIPHHEGAIEMAELVEGRTERQELINLANEIIEVQDEEISQLRGMLDRMGADEMSMGDMGDMGDMDHGDMDGMDDMGMMDAASMDELRQSEGDDFDRRFMEAMIVHHEGAIDMAERVRAEGRDDQVAALADDVIAAQETEIGQMRQWLQEWDLT